METVSTAAADQEYHYPDLKPVEALEQGFILASGEAGITAMATDWRNPAAFEGEQIRQGFLVGEIGIMIHFEEGSELTEVPPLYHLPNAPRWLRGVVNLHGRLIPVFDLLAFLNLEKSIDSKRMLLVLGHGNDAAGIIIDGIPQRLRWLDADLSDADLAPKELEAHVRATALLNNKLWFDLDSASLLNALEDALM